MDERFAVVGRRTVRVVTPPAAAPRAGTAPDRLALLWLGVFAAVLWPHWRWAAARLVDGSDDPLGVAALLVIVAWVVRAAPSLRDEPSPAWLGAAMLLVAVATVLGASAPPLLGALVAALAMAAAIVAFAPVGTAIAPIAGLAALALPIVSSLQFYAGYPLRVVTAEASTVLLELAGFAASREGSAMQVDGRLIVVDAPCSGVQMVWMAYFCACTVACWRGLPDRVFARRVAAVGILVLVGNVLRNCLLVGLEARGAAPAPWLHEGIGLVLLALVCSVVVRTMARQVAAPATAIPAGGCPAAARPDAARPGAAARSARAAGRGVLLQGWTSAALVAVLVACALVPFASFRPATAQGDQARVEAPRTWQGRPLRPLALDAVEARFAARFPGRIERLTDDTAVLVWRQVTTPTRMLHPAVDCYRGLGYRIDAARLERDAEARLWRCFIATRHGRAVRVCERIEDAAGGSFTDASSWFWAAALGRSTGPWQAFTVATPFEGTSASEGIVTSEWPVGRAGSIS